MIGFGKFGKKRDLEIKKLLDERLMLIDPTVKGFFDKVLQFETDNAEINAYIDAVREVKEAELAPFWRPIMDPSEDGGKIIYMKGRKPAVGHSYNWWKEKAEEIPAVEGNIWLLGSEYQYYADEVALINRYVAEGHELEEAIENVVINSAKFGHYADSEGALDNFEPTGSREICDCYDWGNTYKILSCTNNKVADGFWVAGGCCYVNGYNRPLADLCHFNCEDGVSYNGVGWLVLPCSTVH